jgi:Leucine-rich repeat (LRR) protein
MALRALRRASSDADAAAIVSRPRLQFRLRTLLLLVLLFCVLFGAWKVLIDLPNERERDRIAALRNLGAYVTTAPRGPAWMQRLFGERYFQRVIHLDGSPCISSVELLPWAAQCSWLECLRIVNSRDVQSHHLVAIGQLRRLSSLDLTRTGIGDEGMAHIERLPDLKSLDLYGTNIGDEGMRHVGRMRNLRSLDLDGTHVTDPGLEHLKGLSELEVLNLRGTRVTDAGLCHLKALPKLQILNLRIPPSVLKPIGLSPHPFPNTTCVSAEGVADLRRANPGLRIRW